MTKRYLPSNRTTTSDLNAVRDKFLRDLNKEADALLQSYTKLLAQSLQSAFDGSGSISDAGLASLATSAGKYFNNSAPKTTRSTRETDRSREVESRFKLSNSQSLAEAGSAIGKGDKNL